jgi:uncharacterized membrane protein (DUF106 family)
MVFETLLNPIFSPLLRLPPVVAILIIAFAISLIITLVYKYMTDQTMMKDLKMRQKEFQKKMKALKKEPEKMMAVQKQAMQVNMQYMKQSFKPTIITFLPIIIIFGWLNAHLAYEPLLPEEEFTVWLHFHEAAKGNVAISVPDGVELVGNDYFPLGEMSVNIDDRTEKYGSNVALFTLKGKEGDYLLVFDFDGNKYDKELSISEDMYAPPQKVFKKEPLRMIDLDNKKLIAINLFGNEEGGWSKGRFGWLATYIIFSLIFSLGLRKILKLY